jgi:hypothetical protein
LPDRAHDGAVPRIPLIRRNRRAISTLSGDLQITCVWPWQQSLAQGLVPWWGALS